MSADNRSGTGSYLQDPSVQGGWLSSLDHKRIALSYLAAVAGAFALGATFAFFLRAELLSPRALMLDEDTFRRLMSMHGLLMVFCCVLPGIPAVLGNFVLPLMLGSRNLAFPGLNRWGLRLYLVGVGAVLAAVLAGATDLGWTLAPPYGQAARVPLVLLAVGLHALGLHLVFMGLNLVVTVVRRRPEGMCWWRLPILVWSLLATGALQIVVAPVLAALGLMVLFEVGGGVSLFDATLGGDPLSWQRFFWFFGHPALFLALLPAIGVVGEIFVTFARKPLHGRRSSVLALLALAATGLLGWGTHLVAGGLSDAALTAFSALSLLAVVPGAVLLGNWLATLHRGALQLATPLLYGLAFVVHVTIGGLGALFLGALASAERLGGTMFESAVLHYLLVGGAMTAFLAGLHYWWPKFFGREYDERRACWGAGLVFLGVNLAFLGQFVPGLAGLRAGQFAYAEAAAGWQILAGCGAAVLVSGLALVVVNLMRSALSGAPAAANPWGGSTLEWECPSPPPTDNFDSTPPVADLYDFTGQTFDGPAAGYARTGGDQ